MGGDIAYSRFEGAEMEMASFDGAEVRDRSFDQARMICVPFDNSEFQRGSIRDAVPARSAWFGAAMTNMDFRGCDLNHARFVVTGLAALDLLALETVFRVRPGQVVHDDVVVGGRAAIWGRFRRLSNPIRQVHQWKPDHRIAPGWRPETLLRA